MNEVKLWLPACPAVLYRCPSGFVKARQRERKIISKNNNKTGYMFSDIHRF